MTLISIQPDFNYGVSTHDQRVSNWTLFKSLCDTQKLVGGTIDFGDGRIEFYHADKEKVDLAAGQKLNLILDGELIFYPFVPRPGLNYVFDLAYGAELSITGGKIKVAQRGNLFESYRCEFIDPTTIKVLGVIREDFWKELSTGKTIYCTWNPKVLGKTSKVAYHDSKAETITIADALTITSPTDCWIGFDFTETISERSYKTYGRHWLIYPKIFTFINVFTEWQLTGPDTVINLTDVKIENWKDPINISSGSFKVNLKGVVEINNAEIALAVFARGQLNHQSILGHHATLVLRNNGMNSVGSISTISASNIYGSGAYIHPTVIVQIDKVRGYNNPAATFRQYSSSIRVICPPDYQSWIHDFQCEGSGEEDLKTSNCMPVVVDYIKAPLILIIGGNLIVKRGFIGSIHLASTLHPPANTETKIQINDCTIKGPTRSGWVTGIAEFTDLEFNKCIFLAGVAFTDNWYDHKAYHAMVYHDNFSSARSIAINDCEYRKPEGSLIQPYTPGQPLPVGLSASSFLRTSLFMKVSIKGMKTDYMKGIFILQNLQIKPPYDKAINIDDSEINMSALFSNQPPTRPQFLPGQIQVAGSSVPCMNITPDKTLSFP